MLPDVVLLGQPPLVYWGLSVPCAERIPVANDERATPSEGGAPGLSAVHTPAESRPDVAM